MAPGPDVYFTFPNAFTPIPAAIPPTVPPPMTEASLRAPFGINKSLYNFALRPEIPILFATAYIIGVSYGNVYNRKRQHEAWPISKKEGFRYFVIVHNVILALYSSATFVAMFRAVTKSLPAWDEASGGLWRAKTADALCKLHGPRGLGDAASFNTTLNIWEAKNTLIRLGMDGVPDPMDVGRLWNEGLAFWGWIFYVSKFYEVIDTFIILAKGKRSATLQTYHHAGAMLCMWAGIRYMSPPIWMFVFINSAIHAMMYTYFTCSALHIRVPTRFKRTLTSLQIFQFVFGASYAALHLFIKYDIPVSTPFQIAHVVERAASSVSSAGTAATKSATSVASAVSSFVENPVFGTAAASLIKKLLLRAAGDEGVAERIAWEDSRNAALPGQALPRIEDKIQKFDERRFETHWRTEWTTVNCIDTSGEAFAIYLNLLYLAPLTFLFARFFVRAYTARGRPKSVQQAARTASDAARDAKSQTEYSVEKAGQGMEAKADETRRELQDELRKDVEDFKNSVQSRRISDRIGESVRDYEEKVREIVKSKSTSGSQTGSRKSSPSKQGEQASVKEEGVEDVDTDVKKEHDSEEAQTGAKGAGDDEQSYAEVVKTSPSALEQAKNGDDDRANSKPAEGGADGDEEEDTDAMGKSGAIVDTPDSPEPKAGEGDAEDKGDDAEGEGPGQGLFKE